MTLNDDETLWLIQAAKRWRNTLSGEIREDVSAHIQRLEAELEKPVLPLELLIICPRCKEQHVDEGRFAIEPHRDHACQSCGLTFQVAGPVKSIGVQFFRGYKNPVLTITHPPGSKPQVSEPTLLPGQTLVYVGRKVRFKEGARELGYDTQKTFEIAAFTDAGEGKSKVRLVGDDDDWIPSDLLEAAPP